MSLPAVGYHVLLVNTLVIRNNTAQKIEKATTVSEISKKYNIETATVQTILNHAKLPQFVKDPSDPTMTLAK